MGTQLKFPGIICSKMSKAAVGAADVSSQNMTFRFMQALSPPSIFFSWLCRLSSLTKQLLGRDRGATPVKFFDDFVV